MVQYKLMNSTRKNFLLNIVISMFFCVGTIIVFSLVYKDHSSTQLLIDADIPQDDRYQVFFDIGNGFNEDDSISMDVGKKEGVQTLVFQLPSDVKNLRVDFGTKINTIELEKIVWKKFNKKYIWTPEKIISEFNIRNNIDNLVSTNGKLRITPNGNDPFIVIENTKGISDYLSRNLLISTVTYALTLFFSVLVFITLQVSDFDILSKLKIFVTNYRSVVVCSSFIVIIASPMLIHNFGMDSKNINTEQRNLASKPDLNLMNDSYQTYISDYETYVNDNFGFRNEFIKINNFIKVKLLKTSPSEKVIIGRDGWLFYNSEGEIDDYRGTNHFSVQELEVIRENLEKRSQWLGNLGIEFYVTVAPNKSTIYPEFLPSSIKKYNDKSRLDQLINYLADNSEVQIIDLRPSLIENKSENLIYKKNDTHWNGMGAFIGYKEIARRLQEDSIISAPLVTENYELVSEIGGGDLANMLSMNDILLEEHFSLRPKLQTLVHKAEVDSMLYPNPGQLVVTDNPALRNSPKLLMFRDSFATDMIPFLSEHFSKSVYVWDHHFSTDVIEQEKPDIVIFEVVERSLQSLMLDDSIQ